jgi:hypothetical protein
MIGYICLKSFLIIASLILIIFGFLFLQEENENRYAYGIIISITGWLQLIFIIRTIIHDYYRKKVENNFIII